MLSKKMFTTDDGNTSSKIIMKCDICVTIPAIIVPLQVKHRGHRLHMRITWSGDVFFFIFCMLTNIINNTGCAIIGVHK